VTKEWNENTEKDMEIRNKEERKKYPVLSVKRERKKPTRCNN